MAHVFTLALRAAASDAPILLRGESGAGKSTLARMIHARSPRARRPFVTVHCPTAVDHLLASAPSGRRSSARDRSRTGMVAHSGTLFLDEVDASPPSLQTELLRCLGGEELGRACEKPPHRLVPRVIAATSHDLHAEVDAGRFRRALLFRLNVVEIACPPLRDRTEDILPLARRFLRMFASAEHQPVPKLTPHAEAMLLRYAWPGNVRELRDVIQRVVTQFPAQTLAPEMFPPNIATHVAAGT